MNQPKLAPSSDADWRAYYEDKCRTQRNEITTLRADRDRLAAIVERLPEPTLYWLDGEDEATAHKDPDHHPYAQDADPGSVLRFQCAVAVPDQWYRVIDKDGCNELERLSADEEQEQRRLADEKRQHMLAEFARINATRAAAESARTEKEKTHE